MKKLSRCMPWLALFCATLLLSNPRAASQNTAATPAPPPAIAPTVTVESGDLGGKLFGRLPDPARTRRYFIAAEPEQWDFVPQGADVMCGKPLPPPVLANRMGMKVRYVQYTDATFSAKVMPNARLGVLGPVLRGVVGDDLVVTFLNRTADPLSMHPHGVQYDKDNEGAFYQPNPGLGSAVGPGARFTYVWHLDDQSGPLPGEPSSKCWLYHSHVSGDEEINRGLVGFLIVTDPARARPDGTPNDVDREMATLFMIFDESGLGDAAREAAEYSQLPGAGSAPVQTWADTMQLAEQGNRYAINGLIFGNLSGLEMNQGERVRWYLFGLGSEGDMHTAHWHGLRVVEEGRRRTDVVELLPASMKVADMVADNPGSWLFQCHVAEHMREGMFAKVIVHPKDAPKASVEPGAAFFGLPLAEQSLRTRDARAALDFSPNAAAPCELRIVGEVTVFEAFSVFTQSVRVEIGGAAVDFKPNRLGTASTGGSSFQITNASRQGVIYGGLMKFEATLRGAPWLEALRTLGLSQPGLLDAGFSLPWSLKLGEARHSATARLLPPAR